MIASVMLVLSLSAPSLVQPGVPRTSPPAPDADVFLVPLERSGKTIRAGTPVNITSRAGYDNQPAFAHDNKSVLYTSNRGDGHTDIYRYDIKANQHRVVKQTTPESEYSAYPTSNGKAITVIRVEADSTQRLWQLPLDGGVERVLFPEIKPVGYFAQPNDSTWVMFVLGTPATLQIGYHGRGTGEILARDIGRSLHRIPGTKRASVVQKGTSPWRVMELDPKTKQLTPLVDLPPRSEDVAWFDERTLLVGSDTKLLIWRRGEAGWQTLADFSTAPLKNITRLAVSRDRRWLAMVADVASR